jgi:hypothetical protein
MKPHYRVRRIASQKQWKRFKIAFAIAPFFGIVITYFYLLNRGFSGNCIVKECSDGMYCVEKL